MKSIRCCLKNKKGYTLIELLVVLTIVGLVIGTIGQFLVTQIHAFNRENDRLNLQEQATKAVNTCSPAVMLGKAFSSVEIDANGHLTSMTITNFGSEKPTVISIEAGILYLKKGDLEKTLVARDIESVTAKAILSDGTKSSNYLTATNNDFVNPSVLKTSGMEMTFNFAVNQETYTQTVTACFRN